MAKLDLNRIKGGVNKVDIGKQNMNEASMGLIDSRKKTVFIDLDLIDLNEDNHMSMPNVDWLEQDIKLQGLLQPLVVELLSNGRYKLYAGHQRLTAIRRLKDKGEWNADNLVEVKLVDIDAVNVPDAVKRSTKEKMTLRGLNIQRGKSDADLFVEVMDWKEIYADLRANGVDVFEYGVEGAEEVQIQQIAGVKTQTLVAQKLGISHAQVAKFEKVANKGSEQLIDALKAGEIQVSTASEIASKPREEQDQLLVEARENKTSEEVITGDDIRVATHKIEKKKAVKKTESKNKEDNSEDASAEVETPEEEALEGEVFTEKDLKKYLKNVTKYLKEHEVRLDDQQLMRLLKNLNSIEQIITGV